MATGHVIACKRDAKGNAVRMAHVSTILDTRMYQVELPGGKDTDLTSNVIAESCYAQSNIKENEYLLLYSLIDNLMDDRAIFFADQEINIHGRPVIYKSTASWQICCLFKDGSTLLEELSELKESHPLQTAKFVEAYRIDHEPAFNYLVCQACLKK